MIIYRSRIGWEIWGPVILLLTYEAYIFVRNSIWPGIASVVLLGIFFFLLVRKTRYAISKDSLRVKCWFIIDKEINIHSIHRIRNNLNPIASPAASLFGRIEVYYETGKSVIISPSDKKGFIADLQSKNKSILTFEVK